ncbi:hypothetical protein Tco_0093741 [Tanacetum coccineum]
MHQEERKVSCCKNKTTPGSKETRRYIFRSNEGYISVGLMECQAEEQVQTNMALMAFSDSEWKYFIHTITQCLSAKSTTWNEFSGSMSSLIICLATNQKFNLSKYIFDAMVKHLDGGVKFLMYPRFLQVFIKRQLGNMSTLKKIFVNPFHTKKVFANMKRAGNDFSRRITPLFDTMMVQASEEKQPSKKAQKQELEVPQDETEHEESVPTPSNDPQPSGEDSMQLTDLMVLCTKLQTQVLDLEKSKGCSSKGDCCFEEEDPEVGKEENVKTYRFEETQELGKSLGIVELLRSGDFGCSMKMPPTGEEYTYPPTFFNLMRNDGVIRKKEQVLSLNDSTAVEAVLRLLKCEDSDAPTTIEEITLAQTLIQIKAAKPKVVITAATTTTTTRPKARGVVVQVPSEFRVPQETQPSF